MKPTKEATGSSNNGAGKRKPKVETILWRVSAKFAQNLAFRRSGNIILRKQIIEKSDAILKRNK